MPSPPTDRWIPVALSVDLPAQLAMPARLGNETIALWRSASGKVSASADRCPHRGMRLSHGFVRGEALSCIYHGWRYAADGRCLKIPAHPGLVPPDAIRVANYPAEEQDGIVWVARGKPASPLPSLAGLLPLRSITAKATRRLVEGAVGVECDDAGMIELPDPAHERHLLLAEGGDGSTLIHMLVAADAEPRECFAASRQVEAIRRHAEALRQREETG